MDLSIDIIFNLQIHIILKPTARIDGPLLRTLTNIRNRIWFMQNGASVHHTDNIHVFLKDQFQERWIGRKDLLHGSHDRRFEQKWTSF